jgi:hypothetical protein
MRLRNFLIVSLASLVCLSVAISQERRDTVREFLRDKFLFSQDDLAAVDSGKVVTKLFDSDSVSEIAIGGAAHLAVPYEFAAQVFQKIHRLMPNTSTRTTGRFHTPAVLADLNKLTAEANDLNALRNCTPGNCEEKLPVSTMKRFRTEIDWKARDSRTEAISLVKKILVDYVNSYREWGNTALVEYDDQDQPRLTADILDGIVQEQPNLFGFAPELSGYLKDYPKDTLAHSTDYLYWQQETDPGIKPTFVLNHATIYTPDTSKPVTLIATKQLYANHYFEGSLAVTALVGDTEKAVGCYILYLNRSFFDDLRKTGFLSFRSRVRDGISTKMKNDLISTIQQIRMLYGKEEPGDSGGE